MNFRPSVPPFLKDEDGVFVNLATVTKIRREDPYRRPSEEAPWIAETKDGGEHRLWVRDDEQGVERTPATIIAAEPGARLIRLYYCGSADGSGDYHSTTTEIYPIICWRCFSGKVEPVVIGRNEEEAWLTYSCERMNLIEAPQGGRFEFYEVGGAGGVYPSLA